MKNYMEKSKSNSKMEIWKDIPNYEGLYQVSNLGNIRGLYNYRGKYHILKPRLKRGYHQIGLRKNTIRKWFAVHRLVAQVFIANPHNCKYINHKDENKLNNSVENLEWCTAHYNNCYGTRRERVKQKIAKKVLQYDLNNNFIREYPSIADASKPYKTLSNISLCCRGIYKQVYGYIWRFEEVV